MGLYGDGPFRKIRVYLISRFFSIRENRENFMLAKYTWFTVYSPLDSLLLWSYYVSRSLIFLKLLSNILTKIKLLMPTFHFPSHGTVQCFATTRLLPSTSVTDLFCLMPSHTLQKAATEIGAITYTPDSAASLSC